MPENDIIREPGEEIVVTETDIDSANKDIDCYDVEEIPVGVDTELPCNAENAPKKPRLIESVFEFVELLLLTLAAVFIVTTFIFRHSVVDGDSMMNTLQHEDVLIISGLFYTPEQYDIVVIEDHSTGYTHPLVKRVIAVGGDKVRVTERSIRVNGESLDESYVFIETFGYT